MRRTSPTIALSVLAIASLLSGCSTMKPKQFTQAQSPDRLTACSSAPHCVSSQADKGSSHYIAPLTYSGSPEHARTILMQVLRGSDNATVVNADARFVHATFHSGLLHFVDDVTLLIHPQANIIDVKSSARLGFYDFGVNRRRVEDLRNRFEIALKRTP